MLTCFVSRDYHEPRGFGAGKTRVEIHFLGLVDDVLDRLVLCHANACVVYENLLVHAKAQVVLYELLQAKHSIQ